MSWFLRRLSSCERFLSVNMGILFFLSRVKLCFAISVIMSFSSPVRNTLTLYLGLRYRAATNPSPPLFPVPQSNNIFWFLGFRWLMM